MAEKLTPQQTQAVCDRGGDLLVSAAAGSGKTKVLVDRLMSYILDSVDPANVDEFLIITFTQAAAAELRGKIAAKLSEKISEFPENRHLQQQIQRLYMANISTVDSFCGNILRQYAYRLDLNADFRIADDDECAQIMDEVLQKLLEEVYGRIGEDEDIAAFVDTQGIGRNDRDLPQMLIKVYKSARCHPDPQAWLQSCVDAVDVQPGDDAGQSRWGKFLMERLMAVLELQIQTFDHCVTLVENLGDAPKAAEVLRANLGQLRHLRESKTWDQVIERKNIDFGRLTFPKKWPHEDIQEGIKIARTACKDSLKSMLKFFVDPSDKTFESLAGSAPAVRGMVKLVTEFSDAYTAAKRRRRVLDYSDLEHITLDLFMGRSRSMPTAVAREVGKRYREVMVDEYQDSNQVQDLIYFALTDGRNNRFMVGDVKQSIYKFRLADPQIFIDKYNAFLPASQAHPGQERKVVLSHNFRSGGAVLSAVNCVFENCMSPEVGGLVYGEAEALHEGVAHEPLGEPEVELYGIQVREDSNAEEAAFTAKRIRELIDGGHLIRGKDGLRPIRASDVVILLHAPNTQGEDFYRALEQAGLRWTSQNGLDLLQTPHIMALRSLLQAILNPQLDIPLVAALASPVFGFTADDLAAIRSGRLYGSVYDALCRSELPKVKQALEIISALRREARVSSLAQLMESVFTLTKLDGIYGAMADGGAKRADLMSVYQLAVSFSAAGQGDLSRFLEHLDTLEKSKKLKSASTAAGDCVTIMSIHKSKGLEFPVVFLCGLARKFNRQDEVGNVLCHKDLGIGVSGADTARRVQYPTIAKRAISARIRDDALSEELRILYVAMTRARDRLIMTYAATDLAKHLTGLVERLNMGEKELMVRQASNLGDWVLISALGRTEAGELFALGGKPEQTKVSDHPWLVRITEAPEIIAGALEEQKAAMPEGLAEGLGRILSFRYPCPAATTAPSKQTATQRKGRDKDQEAAENAEEPKPIHRYWRKPGFAQDGPQGRERGVALHKAMQYIRYEACTDTGAVEKEIERLVTERFLTAQQGQMVDCAKIASFFATGLGKRLREGKNVLREFKFSILDRGEAYGSELAGEQILLQGVVDCALMDEDGICVIDFKTDRVSEQTLSTAAEGYRPQVEAYAQALTRIFEKPVKKSCLYFFHLERFVEF